MPTFCGAFGLSGVPAVTYKKLIDKDGYTLIDSSGKVLLTKEGDETFWQ